MMEKCKGYNCEATDGVRHSSECFLEHNAALHPGAGNKHPEERYAAYTDRRGPAEPIEGNEEKRAAWSEGFMSRADT